MSLSPHGLNMKSLDLLSYDMFACQEALNPRPLGQRKFYKVLEKCPLAHKSFKPFNPSSHRPQCLYIVQETNPRP